MPGLGGLTQDQSFVLANSLITAGADVVGAVLGAAIAGIVTFLAQRSSNRALERERAVLRLYARLDVYGRIAARREPPPSCEGT